jgi:DNA repair protein RecN (Recombination protein N)
VLSELRVENLILIEEAQLRLAPGLNVLTGETGAGKTVLAHALDLLLGGRARGSIVRPGAGEAYVEGIFERPREVPQELAERIPADAEEIVLARRVRADGRARCYLNGRACSVGEMREAGASLMSFYGQHEHRKLTISTAQRELLDGFCGADHDARVHACADAFAEMQALSARAQECARTEEERARELDLLEHELAEIDAAEADIRAYAQLLAARERARRHEEIRAATSLAADALDPPEGAQEGPRGPALASAVASVQALAGIEEQLDELGERLHALAIESSDLATELRRYTDALETQDAAIASDLDADGRERALAHDAGLESLEARVAEVERIARKHGGEVDGVLVHRTHALARRAELLGENDAAGADEARLEQARVALAELVAAIREGRARGAPQLAAGVREQLGALAMAGATFDIVLERCAPGPAGADEVEFMIAPNPGVPSAPLREIASGGELSRVMLAIMAVAAPPGERATLVFDEVDAGIGGHAARAVGERLRELARSRQVICITHLPQIASLAERHFSISKDTSESPTRASVRELSAGDVVSELVRMLGADGEDSGARRHARELLRAA